MKEDEPKRLGRYLKKGSTLTKAVSISEFSFKEISVTNLTYPDNPNCNVIHAWLHEKSEIDEFVQRNRKVFDDLQDPNLRNPVLKPRDFTYDWMEERKKARKRSSTHFNDEDEFEMALLEEEESEQAERAKAKPQALAEEDSEDEAEHDDDEMPHEEQEENEQTVESLASLQKPAPSESMDEAILGFQAEQEPKSAPLDEAKSFAIRKEPISSDQTSEHNIKEAERFDAGFNEGLLLGQEKAKEEEKERADELAKWASSFKSHLEAMPREILQKSQKNFLDVVGAICEGLLEKKINENVENFEKIIQAVLKRSFGDMKVTIKISSQMYERLARQGSQAGFIQDESLAKDQFKIESEGGVVRSDIHEVVKTMLENMDLHLFSE